MTLPNIFPELADKVIGKRAVVAVIWVHVIPCRLMDDIRLDESFVLDAEDFETGKSVVLHLPEDVVMNDLRICLEFWGIAQFHLLDSEGIEAEMMQLGKAAAVLVTRMCIRFLLKRGPVKDFLCMCQIEIHDVFLAGRKEDALVFDAEELQILGFCHLLREALRFLRKQVAFQRPIDDF